MYIDPSFLKLTDVEFKSEAHRKVAEQLLLSNPRVTNMTQLTNGCKLVNKIPAKKIKNVTPNDLEMYGLGWVV
jgi:hypothetical protein